MSSDEVIKRLAADGFDLKRITGSHHIYAKEGRPLLVTVPHPRKDLALGTLRRIWRDAGWTWPPKT
jgi:predicted RNA binding protein YcfA (HicA-like mRNA interferase family)